MMSVVREFPTYPLIGNNRNQKGVGHEVKKPKLVCICDTSFIELLKTPGLFSHLI